MFEVDLSLGVTFSWRGIETYSLKVFPLIVWIRTDYLFFFSFLEKTIVFFYTIYHQTSRSHSLVTIKCLSQQQNILYYIYFPCFFLHRRILYVGDRLHMTCDTWHMTFFWDFFGIGATVRTHQEMQYFLLNNNLFKKKYVYAFWKGPLTKSINIRLDSLHSIASRGFVCEDNLSV